MKNQNNKTEQLKEMMYQDSLIHFALNPTQKDVMVNATEMAKIFGKRTDNFLVNKETKETIEAIERALNGTYLGSKNKSELTGIPVSSEQNFDSKTPEMSGTLKPKIIDNRGHMGIYFHRLLAIDFASWLDKDFKVWILLTIEEVLFGKIDEVKTSITEIQSTEDKLKEAIESAKKSGNEEALAIIDAFNAHESAKKKKDKAMRMFTRQMKMDL